MKLAARAGRISPSPTLSLTATAKAMAAQGVEVVDFSAGEPDFDTPDTAKAAAEEALASGFTKYTSVSGIEDLKSAIRDKLLHDQGLGFTSEQILVSCGAKHSLFNLAAAFFEAGDEVIIPSPFWGTYRDQVVFHDATPVVLPTSEEEGFAIAPHLLQEKVTSRTKAIIVNSPCNPTGAMYDRATLEGIARIAVEHNLLIISDEIYEKLCLAEQNTACSTSQRRSLKRGMKSSFPPHFGGPTETKWYFMMPRPWSFRPQKKRGLPLRHTCFRKR